MTAATVREQGLTGGQLLVMAIVIGCLLLIIVWGLYQAEIDRQRRQAERERQRRLRTELARHEAPRWRR